MISSFVTAARHCVSVTSYEARWHTFCSDKQGYTHVLAERDMCQSIVVLQESNVLGVAQQRDDARKAAARAIDRLDELQSGGAAEVSAVTKGAH